MIDFLSNVKAPGLPQTQTLKLAELEKHQ